MPASPPEYWVQWGQPGVGWFVKQGWVHINVLSKCLIWLKWTSCIWGWGQAVAFRLVKYLLLLVEPTFSNKPSYYPKVLPQTRKYQRSDFITSLLITNIIVSKVLLIKQDPKAALNRELGWYTNFLTLCRGCTIYPQVVIPSQPGLYRPDLHYQGEWPGIHYVAVGDRYPLGPLKE